MDTILHSVINVYLHAGNAPSQPSTSDTSAGDLRTQSHSGELPAKQREESHAEPALSPTKPEHSPEHSISEKVESKTAEASLKETDDNSGKPSEDKEPNTQTAITKTDTHAQDTEKIGKQKHKTRTCNIL